LITPQQRAALRKSAESRGLEIIGLYWLLMTPSGLYITHPDAFIREETVNDPNLLGPGMGEIGCKPIIAALRATGCDGWLSVEAFYMQCGTERIAKASVEYLQKVLA
jgi:hypothetical protein